MNNEEPVISLHDVGKCYRIYARPQDRLKQAIRDRLLASGLLSRPVRLYQEHWALHNINFEVGRGEAVGILGRNGAGKSTLLQIIAGTLSATTGEVKTSGRITALLELGSGFNPEFTGRENVFHNAQILGLSKREIEEKYDDIVGFADIGDFINQPVKTYSSGMMMRLAFAVQTAVEPKILIVDEALSVGDSFFQAKCMARINRLVDDGVSLLFVSHDIASIRHLCRRAVLLSKGSMDYFGDVAIATARYEQSYLYDRNQQNKETLNESVSENKIVPTAGEPREGADDKLLFDKFQNNELLNKVEDDLAFKARCDFQRVSNGVAEFVNVTMVGERGQTDTFDFGERVKLFQVVKFYKNATAVNVAYRIRTVQGAGVVFGDTRMFGDISRNYVAGNRYVFCWEFELNLGHESFFLQSTLAHPPSEGRDWEMIDMVPLSFGFRVLPRREGMIDGLVAWPASHSVFAI